MEKLTNLAVKKLSGGKVDPNCTIPNELQNVLPSWFKGLPKQQQTALWSVAVNTAKGSGLPEPIAKFLEGGSRNSNSGPGGGQHGAPNPNEWNNFVHMAQNPQQYYPNGDYNNGGGGNWTGGQGQQGHPGNNNYGNAFSGSPGLAGQAYGHNREPYSHGGQHGHSSDGRHPHGQLGGNLFHGQNGGNQHLGQMGGGYHHHAQMSGENCPNGGHQTHYHGQGGPGIAGYGGGGQSVPHNTYGAQHAYDGGGYNGMGGAGGGTGYTGYPGGGFGGRY